MLVRQHALSLCANVRRASQFACYACKKSTLSYILVRQGQEGETLKVAAACHRKRESGAGGYSDYHEGEKRIAGKKVLLLVSKKLNLGRIAKFQGTSFHLK